MKINVGFVSTMLGIMLMSNGCGSLLPKKVEFFQDKVKVVPEQTEAQKETERQVALRAKEKAAQVVTVALSEGVSTNLLDPAGETMKLTASVSESLGPPKTPSTATTDALVQKSQTQLARLNENLDKYRKTEDKDAGKKIEGTGKVQIPYFEWIAIVGAALFIVYEIGKMIFNGGKLALTAAASTNPGAAVGLNVVNVAQSVVQKGFSQLVKGGEDFKDWVEKEITDTGLKAKILDAFQTSHMKSQDSDVQNAVTAITK